MNIRLAFFLVFFTGSLFSQVSTGIILDKTTMRPVPECLVIIKGSTNNYLTDQHGKFALPPALVDQHTVLVFTLLGYNTIEYPLSTYKKDTFFIVPKRVLLKEVEVSASRKNILNPDSQETVLDFDLLNDNLVVLTTGSDKNNLKLMDETGKKIASLKVDKYTQLLKHDCIGNLQLFSPDSTWQIFYDYEKLNQLHPFSTTLYNQIIGRCVCSNSGTYYFQNMKYRNLRTEYFYYSESEKGVRHELARFQDSNKIRSFEMDYNLQYFLDVRRRSHHALYNESVDLMKKHIDQYREELPLDWSYTSWLGRVKTQLIKIDTSLFIANFTDSAIYSVSKNNNTQFHSSFDALRNKDIVSTVYVDADYRETYLIQFFNNKLMLIKFDINSGNALSSTEIPNVPYLPKKIIINAGKVYFVQKNLADEQTYKIIKYYLN